VRESRELREFVLAISEETGRATGEYPHDALTGVFDRRALPDILKRETTWVDRYRVPLCMVLADIRDFGKLNETQGNMAGDLVLKDLAHALRGTVRQTDSLLRYGADEFLCLLPRTDSEGGAAFTGRVRQTCERSPRLRGFIIDFGVAVYAAGKDPNAVLANAEGQLAAQRSSSRPSDPVIRHSVGS
jgi:diguanylate cyclase (GGDEF)-like protein